MLPHILIFDVWKYLESFNNPGGNVAIVKKIHSVEKQAQDQHISK